MPFPDAAWCGRRTSWGGCLGDGASGLSRTGTTRGRLRFRAGDGAGVLRRSPE